MRPRTSLPLHTTEDGKPKRKVKKAVRTAKKQIRKGKNKPGFATVRAKVQDDVGHKTGYGSETSKRLDASKLVQRKYKQERKSTTKAQPSAKKGAAKDWEGESKFGKYGKSSETFTRKEGRKINKGQQKELKADDKKTTKASKSRAKAIRKSFRKK